MPRCFVAITIPQAIRPRLLQAQEALVSQNPSSSDKIRLTIEQNLHLTLKFLGETKESQLETIAQCLEDASRKCHLGATHSKGLGAFPNEGNPRSIYAKVTSGGDKIQDLAHFLDAALAPLGFSEPRQKRVPHITLARIPKNTVLPQIENWLESQSAISFGEFTAPKLALYQSTLLPTGSIYDILHSCPLHMGSTP